MPSSKFNLVPMPILRPSVCKAPHGSCWPAWPPDRPMFTQAYLDLWDLDPLDPLGASGYTVMPMIDPSPTYAGISPDAENRVGAHITPAGPANRWNVTATLYPPGHAPVNWYWNNVYIDPNRPFDTGLLKQIVIPGQDYQNVRIMA